MHLFKTKMDFANFANTKLRKEDELLAEAQGRYRVRKALRAVLYITVSALATIGFCSTVFTSKVTAEQKPKTKEEITRTEKAIVWEGCVQTTDGEVWGYNFAEQPEHGMQVTVVFDTKETSSIYDDEIMSVY